MPELSDVQWRSFSDFLDRALELPESERASWLAALALTQPSIVAEIERVLSMRDCKGYDAFLSDSPLPDTPIVGVTLIGRQIGPYVIESEIGRGGMGSVWRARRADGRFEGTVAIKFVHTAWVGRAGEQRFRVEGNLLGRLNHPNIARLLDAGVLVGTQPYLVLEYVEGDPIDLYCQRESLSLEARIRLFIQVLAAVAHAHSHLVVHRDIKPSNVSVTPDGTVKLLDFGIAKLLGADGQDMTKSGATALTPQYAAPEQLSGRPVTTATDVYALGLLLYALLTGRPAVQCDARSPAELVHVILTEDPPRASLAAAHIPGQRRLLAGDLDNILAKALRKEPGERYRGASEFADDLSRFLNHEPVSARTDTVTYRAGKFVKRHKGAVASALLTLIALIAAATVTTVQMFEAKRQERLALDQLRRAQAFGDLVSIVLSESGNDGEAVTTAELLGRGEKLVRTEFAGDLKLRSQLLYILASLNSQAGLTARQLALYAESNALATKAHDPALTALSGCAMAAASAVVGSSGNEVERIQKILDGLPQDMASNSPRVGCELYLSTAAHFAGQWQLALQSAESANRLLTRQDADTAWSRLNAKIILADAYRGAGKFGAADGWYQAVADEFQRIGVDNTEFAATLYSNWAIDLTQLGQPLRAAALLERSMALDRAQAGGDAFTATNYARALMMLERAEDARRVLEPALARATANHNHISANMVRIGLAAAERELGQMDRSKQLLKDAELDLRPILSPTHEAFGALHSNRAQLYVKQRDYAMALQEIDAALGIFSANPALAHREASELVTRAQILLALDRPRDALVDSQRAIVLFQDILGTSAESYHLGRAWLTLAQIRLAVGDTKGVETAAQTAYDHLMASVGDDHPLTVAAAALKARE